MPLETVLSEAVSCRERAREDSKEGPHRDLKEPEGWRFSSFRKMRLDIKVSAERGGGRK